MIRTRAKNAQTKTMPSLDTTDSQKSNLPVETETSRIAKFKTNIKVQYKIHPVSTVATVSK